MRYLRYALRDKGQVRMGKVIVRYAVSGRKIKTRGTGDQGMLDQAMRTEALAVKGRVCAQCGAKRRLEVDHIVPQRDGGGDELENLQVLCRDCHAAKTAQENAAAKACRPKEVRIGPITYPSIHAASAGEGVDRKTIRTAIMNGTLDQLQRKSATQGISLMRALYMDGDVYASRVHAGDALMIREKAVARRLLHADSAWCLFTFMETWRWRSVEEEATDNGESCVRCGARALRAVHREAWTDLKQSPFTLPVDPVCGKCERVIACQRKPEIRRANTEWVYSILSPAPPVTPEIVAEQLRLAEDPPVPLGQARPILVNDVLWAAPSEAARHYGGSPKIIYGAIRDGIRWRGMETRWAPGYERPHYKKYCIRGEEYTAPEAARKFGVSVSRIYGAESFGNLDSVGVGQGRGPKRREVRP